MLARATRDPFELSSRDFGQFVNRMFGEYEVPGRLAPYAVDVHEDADHFYVTAELPGFTKDHIDITLENGVLTLSAQRKEEHKSQGTPLHIERRWTQFARSFALPTAVNESAVRAELNEGVLTVTLDKREEVKPRKIQISVANGSSSATSAVAPTNGNGQK
jgi:HSP20 family protein